MKTNEEMKKLADEYFENHVELSEQEEAYRRGYRQGFYSARYRPDVSWEEVREWGYSNHKDDLVAPPGSGMEGEKLHGLTKDDEHRFFINRLKPPIGKED